MDCLTRSAPVVVFSCAVPGQAGSGHINCQWPWYWRDLFAKRGYACVDAIRPLILWNERIAWYYQQNILCFLSNAVLPKYPGLQPYLRRANQKWYLVPIAERILRARVEKLQSYPARALLVALVRKALKRASLGRR